MQQTKGGISYGKRVFKLQKDMCKKLGKKEN